MKINFGLCENLMAEVHLGILNEHVQHLFAICQQISLKSGGELPPNCKKFFKQVGFCKVHIHVIQFLQHASIFISIKMTHEKCFKMMTPLDPSREVTC